MKRTMFYDDAAAIHSGLDRLYRYNRAMYQSVNHIDVELVEHFFRAEDNSDEEISIEKMLSAAAVQSCYDDPYIAEKHKKVIALNMARQLTDSLRASKIEYKYCCGCYGNPAYMNSIAKKNLELNKIPIVRKATNFDAIYSASRKTFKFLTQKVLAYTIGVPYYVVKYTIIITSYVVDFLLPKEVKQAIKEKSKQLFVQAANSVEHSIQRLKNTRVVKKVIKVYENEIKPYIKSGYEIVKNVGQKISVGTRKAWGYVKGEFKNIISYIR